MEKRRSACSRMKTRIKSVGNSCCEKGELPSSPFRMLVHWNASMDGKSSIQILFRRQLACFVPDMKICERNYVRILRFALRTTHEFSKLIYSASKINELSRISLVRNRQESLMTSVLK
ncbi:hypothetical protein AXF42_Ash014232 [Apostasia shenzhenica]|uniref:Uncharacterized protein n=1 Tax=Apostasia shenzhenica TaxID=1088818 RepID=A0A2I0A1A5_9ASPA|nr:hypothetical protein AXF42_Ash014232 [Apostasia shenzhenica]